MTDPLTLFERFADSEEAAHRVTWAEPDEDAFYDGLSPLSGLLDKGLRKDLSPIGHRFFAEEEDFTGEKVDTELARIRRRSVFATSTWRDAERGLIVTGYLGPRTTQIDDGIYQRFHLALDLEPPKIIGYDVVCSTCSGTGQRSGAACEDCGGGGFQRRGASAPLTGDPRTGQLRVVQAPTDDRSKAILAAHGG